MGCYNSYSKFFQSSYKKPKVNSFLNINWNKKPIVLDLMEIMNLKVLLFKC